MQVTNTTKCVHATYTPRFQYDCPTNVDEFPSKGTTFFREYKQTPFLLMREKIHGHIRIFSCYHVYYIDSYQNTSTYAYIVHK